MIRRCAGTFALLHTLAAPAARADIDLIARQSVPGALSDLSGLTGPLENGVPGNILGGYGSSIANTGIGSVFIVVPDRGPNANNYNPLVDDTTSYINRFHTMDFGLEPAPAGSTLPYALTPVLKSTTLFSSPTPLFYGTGALGTDGKHRLGSGVPPLNAANQTNYFIARTDGFDPAKPSMNPGNARMDPEGVRVAGDGKSLFVSDEYGPYVYQFDRATGRRVRSYRLPDYYGVSTQGATGEKEVTANARGRIANRGMEGLAITPDGGTLVGLMQNPLVQDGGRKGVRNRIVTIDVATEVTGLAQLPAEVTPVAKTLFLDLLEPKHGLRGRDFPQKIEGIAFGPDVVMNGRKRYTLFVTSDNVFLVEQPTWIYVFAIDPEDLKGYQPQRIAGPRD